MNKPIFVVAVILILVLSGLAEAPQIKAASKTIVVQADYATIQEAIDSAADEDTIFVKSEIYFEARALPQNPILN